jgi:hypothetical protein
VDKIYVDKATKIQYLWDGTAYKNTEAKTIAPISSATFPATPVIGDIFKKTPENVLYIYDGTDRQNLTNVCYQVTPISAPAG